MQTNTRPLAVVTGASTGIGCNDERHGQRRARIEEQGAGRGGGDRAAGRLGGEARRQAERGSAPISK